MEPYFRYATFFSFPPFFSQEVYPSYILQALQIQLVLEPLFQQVLLNQGNDKIPQRGYRIERQVEILDSQAL